MKSEMKTKKEVKKIPYIDYECNIGDRVQWRDLLGKSYEGVLIAWDDETVAIIKQDDGTLSAIPC